MVCKRAIKDSWAELKEHIFSRDDIPDDVREAFESDEYRAYLGGELYFIEPRIPVMYYRIDDIEEVPDRAPHDSAYQYYHCNNPSKTVRIHKDNIEHTHVYADLCYACAMVLQCIHDEGVAYTDGVVEDTCITQDAKLTAEIVIKDVTEQD